MNIKSRVHIISKIILLLIFLQLLLLSMTHCIFLFIKRTNFVDSMATMFAMIIITVFLIIFMRKKKISLSIFPKKLSAVYIIATIVAILLFTATPSNFTGGFQAIILLFFSSMVTPIFEEIIFRSYVWNKLNNIFSREWETYIVTTALFAFWHIGYISSIAFRVQNGLAMVMVWKVITGLCFGIILGAVRLKTKNSYSTILLHGVLNIFGR